MVFVHRLWAVSGTEVPSCGGVFSEPGLWRRVVLMCSTDQRVLNGSCQLGNWQHHCRLVKWSVGMLGKPTCGVATVFHRCARWILGDTVRSIGSLWRAMGKFCVVWYMDKCHCCRHWRKDALWCLERHGSVPPCRLVSQANSLGWALWHLVTNACQRA